MIVASVAALLLAQAETGPWTKHQQGPQKLVLTWPQGGVAVIDYPSWDRCQRAREAVEFEAQRRTEAARRNAPAGVIGSPWTVYAFCIPG